MKILKRNIIISMLLALLLSVTILVLIFHNEDSKKNERHLLFIPPEADIVKFWILIPNDIGAKQYNLNSLQIKNWMITLKATNRRATKFKALLGCSVYIQTENSLFTYYITTNKSGDEINVDNPSFHDCTIMDDDGNVYYWDANGIE